MKTTELIGALLDWAIATIEEPDLIVEDFLIGRDMPDGYYRYSEDATQGHAIIEREGIALRRSKGVWYAMMPQDLGDSAGAQWAKMTARGGTRYGVYSYQIHKRQQRFDGPTALIAACRCWVAHKLGPEITLPEGLTNG